MNKEKILDLAYEYSEGSGKRYVFTEDSLLEMMWVALSQQTEPAPAQDERDFWVWLDQAYRDGSKGESPKFTKYNMQVAFKAGAEWQRTRPAQKVNNVDTHEQQPIYQIRVRGNREWSDVHADGYRISLENPTLQTRIVYAAPIAQPDRDTKAAAFELCNGRMDYAGEALAALQGEQP